MTRWTVMLVTLGLLLAAPAAFATEGDYNGDGVIDDTDREIVTTALGTVAGDPGFVAAADHDGDGVITLQDVGYLLRLSQQ